MLASVIGRLRIIGFLEGVSFLVLLGVAMPLKYMAGMPDAVRFVGWAHGLLFVLYIALSIQAANTYGWSVMRLLGMVLASVLPFGPFVADRRLRREQAELTKAAS